MLNRRTIFAIVRLRITMMMMTTITAKPFTFYNGRAWGGREMERGRELKNWRLNE